METRDQLDLSYMYKINPHKNKLYDGDDMPFGWDFDKNQEVKNFLQNSNIENFLYLIAKSYKNKYANHIEFRHVLSNKKHSEINKNILINYDSSELRTDIREFEWEIHYKEEYSNDYYLNRLKIIFTSPQNANVLKENIKQALQGKSIIESGDVIEISDSALLKVKVTANDFEMWINPERVVYY